MRSTAAVGTLLGMRRRSAIKVLVPGGLALALLANLWIETPPAGIPGVAFGSETVLVVERTVALFVAWMFALVILAESWSGRLPLEISGRGVRYADAAATHTSVDAASKALVDLQAQLDDQARLIDDLQECYEYEKAKRGCGYEFRQRRRTRRAGMGADGYADSQGDR